MTNSIANRAVDSPDLGTLVTLVTLAELVEALDGPGKMTVFAPTNEAFNALLAALNVDIKYFEENLDFLIEVLTYHVVPGIYAADDLLDGLYLPTLQGERLLFDVTDGNVRVNGQAVVGSALANNGIVHVIDGVLAPSTPFPPTSDSTIVDVAVSLSDTFSTLVSLVTLADLVDVLSQPFQFTVFAPINKAFGRLDPSLVALLQTRPWKMHLRSILLYHVLEGAVFAADIQNGMEAQTLMGDTVRLAVSDDGVFVNDNTKVVSADVSADNGVIHAVNKVLFHLG